MEENYYFSQYVKQRPGDQLDAILQPISEEVTRAVDCTQCGGCCKVLMVNVTPAEAEAAANRLQVSEEAFKAKYIEGSQQGQFIINKIPCHFLTGSICSIYEDRFTECRDFPHLHKPNFKDRVSNTITYYGICPIIYNTIEILKEKTGFRL